MPKAKQQASKVAEVRRANLRSLIAQRGGANALAKQLGYSNASFLSQMCGPSPMREVTEKTARRFEARLGLPMGYLDKTDAPVPVAAPAPAMSTDVLRLVGKLLDDEGVSLPNMKLMELIAIAMSTPNPEVVRSIVRLLK